MSYLKTLLQPNEKILFRGRVHWIVMVPGIGIAAVGWLVGTQIPYVEERSYALLTFGVWLENLFRGNQSFAEWGSWANDQLPSLIIDPKWVGLVIVLYGFSRFLRAAVLMYTTELLITPYRVLSKSGLYTIFVAEIDRARIAGTYVLQPIWGRVFNYGYVSIQGFSGSIGGLPPLHKPQRLQAALLTS